MKLTTLLYLLFGWFAPLPPPPPVSESYWINSQCVVNGTEIHCDRPTFTKDDVGKKLEIVGAGRAKIVVVLNKHTVILTEVVTGAQTKK